MYMYLIQSWQCVMIAIAARAIATRGDSSEAIECDIVIEGDSIEGIPYRTKCRQY